MVYQVLPQAPVRVKRIGTIWTGENINIHSTVKLNTFTDQELTLDPDSIFAPVENTSTARIKARWMECGYYGFVKSGWLMLVPNNLVIRRDSC